MMYRINYRNIFKSTFSTVDNLIVRFSDSNKLARYCDVKKNVYEPFFQLGFHFFLITHVFWKIWLPDKIWMAYDCQKMITQSMTENIILDQLQNFILLKF